MLIAAPSDHSHDGSHTITYYSTDTAGNAETPHTATVRIDTPGGALVCTDSGGGLVTVDMGAPILFWDKVPLSCPADTNRFMLSVNGTSYAVSAVSMGLTARTGP